MEARQQTGAVLGSGRLSADGLIAAVEAVWALGAAAWTTVAAEAPTPVCRRGCSHCCHQTVNTTAPEVLVLAEALRHRDSPDRLVLWQKALHEEAAAAADLAPLARFAARVPCTFLDTDGACAIHTLRPLQCRAVLSTDVGFCESLLTAPEATSQAVRAGTRASPYLEVSKVLYNSLQLGMAAAFQERGAPAGRLALAPALAVALARPDAAGAWLAGADVFAAARLGA